MCPYTNLFAILLIYYMFYRMLSYIGTLNFYT